MPSDNNELLETAKEYIDLMKKNGLGYFRVKNDKFEIELGEKHHPHMGFPPMMPPPPQAYAAQQAPFTPPAPAQGASMPAAQTATHTGIAVKSPIVGTFYASSAPGKPPYVTIGQQVHKGDVLFIIESMKLMNEVTSEFDGIVSEILINDGDTVEYGQPILMIV